MADNIRNTTFLLKKSGVPGKIPTALQLGEVALNFADVILYASGTTAGSILPIGWDRVARTGDTMTGGLFTPSITATTISATSINKVDYIVFNTGTTSAATVAGTVYFDNTEHALSYNTSINQGVTVNMGQQNYIRVFNNSGVDIQRGKALEVLSSYSGLPSVTLAINKHTGFNIIGVSAEIIPNNSEGIAITNGIISNIELTGMTIGSLVYASDTVAGKLDDATKYLSFPLTARTNQIGFVVQTGITTGKLFIDVNNENSVLSLTDLERNVLEGNVISTGAFEFTGMTTASTTTFNIAPLKGWLVKNTYEYALTPDVQSINYTGGTNISVTNIASADSTYILINSGLTITQQVTFPTPQERRQNIFLGKINHPNRSTILNINNTVDYDVSPLSSLRDLWSPIKLINQGIIPSPNGANLSFNTSAGILWGNGINWHNNQLSPNNVSIAGKTPASFNYRTQTGGTSSSVTVINPRNYDVGGVITSIGNDNLDNATNQRIYIYPTGVINVLYGQTVYANLTAAVAAVQSETFIPYPNADANGILIGVLSVRNDIGTDGQPLTNASYAKFTFVSKFGESFGGTGGLSTTTLQQAYDNSSTPEIIINAALDGLSIQNGTGNADNTTRLLEGLNAAGSATSFIRADGDISGTTLQTNGFTGNTTGMSALTVNIRTIGSGISVTNLGVDSFGNVVSGTTGGSTFTGGTVTGPTNFTNGLTANTISATTIKTASFTANNGGLTASTVSATTYYNLPIDVYSTGGTYNGGNIYVTNNTGGTFTITGLTSTGFSANYYGSFSDTNNQPVSGSNLATIWTYNTTELSNGVSVVNNSQIKVANKGIYEIGYSAQLEKTQGTNSTVTIWATKNGVIIPRTSSELGLVSNSTLQLPFVSFIFELEANDYIEFYMSSDSQYVQLTAISASTIPTRPSAPSVIIVAKQVGLSVTDNLSGYYLPLSGGTVTGATNFISGLTANTISVIDPNINFSIVGNGFGQTSLIAPNGAIVLTPGLYGVQINGVYPDLKVNGNTITDGNLGVGTSSPVSKLDVNGDGRFIGGLTANTISATTYSNLPIDVRVTGGTYSDGSATFTNNTGGTFTVTGFSTGTTLGTYLTGATYSNNIITFKTNSATTSTVNIDTMTGLTVNGAISATTISATTSVTAPIFNGNTSLTFNAKAGNLALQSFSQNVAVFSANRITLSPILITTALNNAPVFTLTHPANANQSTAFEATGFKYNGGSTNFTGGTLATQRENYWGTTTYSFTVAGSITNAYGMFIEAPTAGTNATITNNYGLGVSGNTIVYGSLSANTIYGTNLTVSGGTQSLFSGNSSSEMVKVIQVGAGDAFVVEDQANTDPSHFVINASGNTAIGLTQPLGNDKLTVSGNTSIYGDTVLQALTATSATISGSGSSILTVVGSGSTTPIFKVQGSQGELFSITDSLTGSLFSVNDISGLPILEVFSDNTTLMGNYLAPSLNTTAKVSLTAGTNTVYSIPTSAYTGAFFDYVVISTGSTGARSGNIMSVWSGSTAQYNEVASTSIGTTTAVTFSVGVSGNYAVLSSSATTAGWNVKVIIRSI